MNSQETKGNSPSLLKIIRLEKSSQSWKIIAKRRSKTISTNTLERRGRQSKSSLAICPELTSQLSSNSKEIIEKALAFSDELSYYYELYQLLLFHFQEKNRDHFFSLIQEHKHYINPAFKKVFQTFIRYDIKTTSPML